MTLGLKHAYKLFAKYPGMRPKDEAIWDAFIMSHPETFDFCYYNVHLGDPAHDDAEREEMRANGMFDVSQWCVDVLAFKGAMPFVIEVKPYAGAGAIGQALAYRAKLIDDQFITANAQAAILTDNFSPILLEVCQLLNVAVWTP